MVDINQLMNSIHNWQQPVHPESGTIHPGFFRFFAPRAANLFITAPLGLLHVGKNVVIAAVQVPAGVLKAGVSLVRHFTQANPHLKQMSDSLWSLSDFFERVARIACYVLGLFSSLLLGALISPRLNERVHVALGLVSHSEIQESLVQTENEEIPSKNTHTEELQVIEEVGPMIEVLHSDIDPLLKMTSLNECRPKMEAIGLISSRGSEERGKARMERSRLNEEGIMGIMADEESQSGKVAAGRIQDELKPIAKMKGC